MTLLGRRYVHQGLKQWYFLWRAGGMIGGSAVLRAALWRQADTPFLRNIRVRDGRKTHPAPSYLFVIDTRFMFR